MPNSPQSEAELMERCRGIAGRTLRELAQRVGWRVPEEARRAKGFTGQLLEECLGATAGSKSVPDFERLGVEMKSIPVSHTGSPLESTYVSTTTLVEHLGLTWEHSRVRKKLARVLWVPVQSRPLPLAERRVGNALLWSPSAEEESLLRNDWEEHMERIRLGMVETITGRDGVVLQIRPKAADSKALTWGIDENGHRFRTLPRGFYIRPAFTARILQQHFRLPRKG